MKLTVHDVGHGLCVSLMHWNGNVMLWDCGHQDDNRPSDFLPRSRVSKVDCFFVTNYDEDHISDLPNLRRTVDLKSLCRNKSISGSRLRALKLQSGPLSPAMESMLDMIDRYTIEPLVPPLDTRFPGVRYSVHYNQYSSEFPDTNNISLVTFLECGNTKFIIPGDLEVKGWKGFLGQSAFRNELVGVNVFIASHHGRENGYCEEVFRFCHPGVFVFSDSVIKHATQEMAQRYARHAPGVLFNGQTRRVLSTRKDGSICVDMELI